MLRWKLWLRSKHGAAESADFFSKDFFPRSMMVIRFNRRLLGRGCGRAWASMKKANRRFEEDDEAWEILASRAN